ncbi:MAG: alpha-glucosidase [Bacteroidales bacterium 45-6]|nr:MAG: alpha-glucosidase [Bacteroidales bacterium 45-6]
MYQIRQVIKLFLLSIVLLPLQALLAQQYDVVSPNGMLKLTVVATPNLQYSISYNDTQLISPSGISMSFNNGMAAGVNGTVKSANTRTVNNEIPVLFGKNKTLTDNFNELEVVYDQNYSVLFRVYDDGMAYRFVTRFSQDVIVNTEAAVYNFPKAPLVYFPEATTLDHWEKSYTVYSSINNLGESQYAVIPVLFSIPDTNYKLVLTEADNNDYPGLYIQKNGSNSMKGMWAQYPDSVDQPNNVYSQHSPITRFNYLARSAGARNYPWRVFVVSAQDKDLLNNELVYKLAEPQKLSNVSWIEPGKSAWEWWHKAMLTADGSADPANGIPANGNANLGLDLYKYYVDFAAANNLKYMTLDAGWSDSYVSALCTYAKTKGVKIVVWTWASNALESPNWVAKMKRLGISGAKIDFFNRDDQLAMRWGAKLAQDLANNQMVGIFHGCPVPTGLNRAYPNILNFEAVLGNEENFWRRGSNPNYHVQFPFIRSLAGPEDYTPGSMRNKTERLFTPVDLPNTVPSSQGTRAHELSMYIVFDQWLGYLCDAPTEYAKYPDILDFLSKVPTVWDKTVPLDAKLGDYIVMAKQKGTDWYVGGMASWTGRSVDVDFSFLSPNTTYKATILRDSATSSDYPTRYVAQSLSATSASKLTFNMSKGGGFVIRLTEDKTNGINNVAAQSPVLIRVDKAGKYLSLSSEDAILSATIINISGQNLISKNFYADAGLSKQISLSSLSSGTYLVKVKTTTSSRVMKFIYV